MSGSLRGTWHVGASTLPGPLRHDPDEVRRRAEELLSRPPYVEEQPGVFARALGWLGDRIAALLDGAAFGTMGPLIAWTIAVLGALALGIVAWRLTRGTVAGRTTTTPTPTLTVRTAAQWHAEADDHEANDRRRDALRCRYAALVVGLVERGIIEDLPGRTVRELDAEVTRADPTLAPAVIDAGERFERGVYGRLPVGDEDLARVREVAYAVSSPRRALATAGRP